jgi:hypothetical protein
MVSLPDFCRAGHDPVRQLAWPARIDIPARRLIAVIMRPGGGAVQTLRVHRTMIAWKSG